MTNGSGTSYLQNMVRAQDHKIKALHQSNQQLSVACASISTLAALSKEHLEKLINICDAMVDDGSVFKKTIEDARAFNALPNNHPVNEVLRLVVANNQLRGCVAGYQTQQEHMEARIRDLEQKLAERR